MRSRTLLAATVLLSAAILPAQQLSSADQATIDTLRSRYYNLPTSGFDGMKCLVKFDLATVPLLSPEPFDSIRVLLQKTQITLAVDGKGRSDVQLHYPAGASPSDTKQAAQVTGLMRAFVSGVFQTWPSKGLTGPIPSFDNQIQSIVTNDTGRTIALRVPGGPVSIHLDKQDNVTEIVSAQGQIKEHPQYTPSLQGLVFTANNAIDTTGQDASDIRYEMGIGIVDGLRIPVSVRLKVNANIDVRYSLEACEVRKALILKVAPPPK